MPESSIPQRSGIVRRHEVGGLVRDELRETALLHHPLRGVIGEYAIEVEGDTVRVLDLPEQLQIESDPRAATSL